MLVQHEHQHNETMLQTLQLADAGVYSPGAPRAGPAQAPPRARLAFPAGRFAMGAAEEGFAYDNERPRHEVELPAFSIDRAPVTNAAFAEFVDDGGYGAARALDATRAGRSASGRAGSGRCYWTSDGRRAPLRPHGGALSRSCP